MKKQLTATVVAMAWLTASNMQCCLSEPAKANDLNVADAKDAKEALSMLERGADPNKPCKLCRNGPPNEVGLTPLHSAAKWNSTELIDALLKKGVAVDPVGKMYRESPLLVAAYAGNAEAVDSLLKAGAKPNLDGAYGNALSSALTGLSEGYWRDDARNARYLRVVNSLVAAVVNVNEDNGGGSNRSIKDMVLQNKNPEFMQQLRVAIGMTKGDGKTGGLTSEQITKTLSSTKLANISALAPLIKSGDSAVRSRALDLFLELATDDRSESPVLFMLVSVEGEGRSLALLGQEVFNPQLTSAIITSLDDPQAKVRIKALQTFRALAHVDAEVLKAVTDRLMNDLDGNVKIAAAGTLASFAASQKPDMTPQVVKTLESALAREKNAQAKLGIAMIINFEHAKHSESKPAGSAASPPRVLAMVFGRAMGFHSTDIKETTSIPDYHDGHSQAGYRFCMVLDARDNAPHIKLKLIMPAKRTDWSFGHNLLVPGFDGTCEKSTDGTWNWKSNGKVQVSADGKVGTYVDEFTQGSYGNYGLYAATWPTDEETVPGKYKLEVYFNDKLEKAYDFDLFEKKAK